MVFKVITEGTDGHVFFTGVQRRFVTGLESANRQAASILIDGIRQSALSTFRHNSPGGLADSFGLESASREGAEIGSSKPYAAIHETGGTIYARNAPWLHFPVEDGTFRKVKSVVIPATGYITRGVESKRDELEEHAHDWMVSILRDSGADE